LFPSPDLSIALEELARTKGETIEKVLVGVLIEDSSDYEAAQGPLGVSVSFEVAPPQGSQIAAESLRIAEVDFQKNSLSLTRALSQNNEEQRVFSTIAPPAALQGPAGWLLLEASPLGGAVPAPSQGPSGGGLTPFLWVGLGLGVGAAALLVGTLYLRTRRGLTR
jgi:hypothetical protein